MKQAALKEKIEASVFFMSDKDFKVDFGICSHYYNDLVCLKEPYRTLLQDLIQFNTTLSLIKTSITSTILQSEYTSRELWPNLPPPSVMFNTINKKTLDRLTASFHELKSGINIWFSENAFTEKTLQENLIEFENNLKDLSENRAFALLLEYTKALAVVEEKMETVNNP